MDNLTVGVQATLESVDREEEMQRIAQRVVEEMAGEKFSFKVDEAIGAAVLAWIGERLSLRFDGAVEHDGIHDCLWMTFIGFVDWAQIGKSLREE